MSSVFLVATLASLAGLGEPEGVVISEIHYHPPAAPGGDQGQDKGAEFIELHNPTAATFDLSGWELSGAVEYEFPAGVSLSSGQRLVVCRRRSFFLEVFGLAENSAILGDFDGALENDSDTVLLRDARRAFVDVVRYEDRFPWPEAAGGDGASLQRICATAPGEESRNWSAGAPTPLEANAAAACPLPAFVTPPVTIHEIHYHPTRPSRVLAVGDDGEATEFVELHNTTGQIVNLRGWSFSDGIDFAFPDDRDTILPPGGFLVVARDEGAVREAFGTNAVAGSYDGRLANSGERVTLVDAAGELVDSIVYDDTPPWPYSADGGGRTLERVSNAISGERAANWRASRVTTGGFQKVTVFGTLRGTPTERFVVSSNAAGEYIIDNVVVESLAQPGINLVGNGTFDTGIQDWSLNGVASGSVWLADGGVGGSGALKVISSGPCGRFEICGSGNAVVYTLPPGLDQSATYRISLDVQYVSGPVAEFTAGVFGGATAGFDHVGSPGAEGTASGTPLLVSDVGRFPREPTSADPTWITARVQYGGEDPLTVELLHNGGIVDAEPDVAVVMLDDGMNEDGLPGDGVFGAALPAFPHNTQLRYRIEARAGQETVLSPPPFQAGTPASEEVWGYYVNDSQTPSDLPAYHILLDGVDGSDKDAVNGFLRCTILQKGSFAHRGELYPDVQVRFRGNTMCVVDKRNFKVRFNDGRFFRGLRKLNFNSMWTDKSLVREHMAWRLIDELGLPYSQTEYARLHISGSYYGLFLCLEHPDQRFLERNDLDPDGNLYKAEQPSGADPSPKGVSLPSEMLGETFEDLWEEETNEGGDYSDLDSFVRDMHADGNAPDGPTLGFWEGRTDPELLIQYQVGQVALNNIDSFAKNHFLYHDLGADIWGLLAWDLDLCLGKFFAPCAVDPEAGRQVGTLNDILLCDPQPNRSPQCQLPPPLNPWFAATVNDNVLRNWVVDLFFNAGEGYYQRAYLKRLWDVISDKVSNEVFDPELDALVVRLAAAAEEDFARWGRYPTNVPGTPDGMAEQVELVKGEIACHRDFLRSYIEENHGEIPGLPEVKFTELLYNPLGGDSDLEFVEIKNLSAGAADLSGWTIEGGIRFTFPAGTTLAGGELLLVAKDPASFARQESTQLVFGPFTGKLDNAGEELRLRDAGAGYAATIDYLDYRDAGEWPEVRPGESIELTSVVAGRDNDVGRNWRASAIPGGTPGRSGGLFSRGDANADERFDVTDALFIVNWLFLAGQEPGCIDSADVDDSARVDVTDAVVVLNFLFLSGPQPAPPFPEIGEDQTPDDLTCLTSH